MSELSVRVPRRAAEAPLCGFSRCRQPLPPPGPRGGRPYEFCPERVWPGGRGCKQLANAADALREAVGDTGDAMALAGTVDEFGTRVDQVLGPLQDLAAALADVRARVEADLTAATARADQADDRAAEDRGLRDQAQQLATEAADRAAQAEQLAAEHERRRAEAERLCQAAQEAARDAELGRARAETEARAERDRADAATIRAETERGHAERSAAEAAQARQELTAAVAAAVATVTTERDAARAALADARQAARDAEDRATQDRYALLAAQRTIEELNAAAHQARDAADAAETKARQAQERADAAVRDAQERADRAEARADAAVADQARTGERGRASGDRERLRDLETANETLRAQLAATRAVQGADPADQRALADLLRRIVTAQPAAPPAG